MAQYDETTGQQSLFTHGRTRRRPSTHPGTREFLLWFAEAHREYLGGSYAIRWETDGPLAKRLLANHRIDHLKRLAIVMFGAVGDSFIERSDRSVAILSVKSTWLSMRLAEAGDPFALEEEACWAAARPRARL